MASKRKLIVKSAQYWFDQANNLGHDRWDLSDRCNGLLEALNHTESALKWALQELKKLNSFALTEQVDDLNLECLDE